MSFSRNNINGLVPLISDHCTFTRTITLLKCLIKPYPVQILNKRLLFTIAFMAGFSTIVFHKSLLSQLNSTDSLRQFIDKINCFDRWTNRVLTFLLLLNCVVLHPFI